MRRQGTSPRPSPPPSPSQPLQRPVRWRDQAKTGRPAISVTHSLRLLLVVLIIGCALFYAYLSPLTMASNHELKMEVDIAIIGAGLAGLAAGIEAASADPSATVLVIEREAKAGGNSAKASSGINAAISTEDYAVFEKDILKSGGGLSNENLVDVLVKQSPLAIEFLEQSEVDLSVLTQLGGHSSKRTHRNKSGPNVGFAIISALQKRMAQFPNIQMMNSAAMEKFLVSDDSSNPAIQGVQVKKASGESVLVHSRAVILATGGFSSNHALLERFAPGMEEFPTTNGPCAQGDGVVMAEALGADLTLMDKVQLHPTGFINPKDRDAQQKFLAPEAIRGSGALLLNSEGKRFTNELSTRDVVSQAILAQPKKMAFMWLFEGAKPLESSLGFYKHIGLVKQVGSVREAAEYCNLDAQVVLHELNEYAAAANGRKADAFGKQYFPFPLVPIDAIDSPVEIHVMEIAPAVHYCMGGVQINEQTEVLRGDGTKILGVYAAGEVSGGVHGANRLGGNSLAECVVFGRIAGQEAVKFARPAQSGL